MKAESSRLRSTETTSSDITAIWPGGLLCVYLVLTGIVLLAGGDRVASSALAMHLAALIAIAAATWWPAVPQWLRVCAPLVALLFLYSEVPTLIAATGMGRDALLDSTVIEWERALFGGQPAVDWARRWRSRVASEALHVAYLSYYGIIFSVPAGLYLARRRSELAEAVFIVMLTFVSCFAFYIVFPVAGPRYLWTSPADALAGPARATTIWLLEAGSSRGTAFPSSHVAVAVTQTILALRYFGLKGLPIAFLTTGLALGAVYGGFHYAVDVVAGAFVGGTIAAAGLAISALRRRRRDAALQANARAPT